MIKSFRSKETEKIWLGQRSKHLPQSIQQVADMNNLENIHPGEVLLEEFLIPMSLSQNRIARDIGVPPRRINKSFLVNELLLPILPCD